MKQKEKILEQEVCKIIPFEVDITFNGIKITRELECMKKIDVMAYVEQVVRILEFSFTHLTSYVRNADFNSLVGTKDLDETIKAHVGILDTKIQPNFTWSIRSDNDDNVLKLVLRIHNDQSKDYFNILISFNSPANFASLEKSIQKIPQVIIDKILIS